MSRAVWIAITLLTLGCLGCGTAKEIQNQDQFREAASSGDLPAVRDALAAGAKIDDLDDANRTAISDAATNDHPDVVAFLISKGAKLNIKDTDGRTPLSWAVDPKIKKMLEDARAKK